MQGFFVYRTRDVRHTLYVYLLTWRRRMGQDLSLFLRREASCLHSTIIHNRRISFLKKGKIRLVLYDLLIPMFLGFPLVKSWVTFQIYF